jgi:hypothetical protein
MQVLTASMLAATLALAVVAVPAPVYTNYPYTGPIDCLFSATQLECAVLLSVLPLENCYTEEKPRLYPSL